MRVAVHGTVDAKEALREFIAVTWSKLYKSAALTFQQAIRVEMNDDLPTLFVQEVESQTPDDVTDIIYLQNDTDRTYVATVRAKFFTTVDDVSGQAVHHGPTGTEVELTPGERARVGDILGWEWDSYLGLVIEFRHAEGSGSRRVSYTLKSYGRVRHVDGLGEVLEVPPDTMRGSRPHSRISVLHKWLAKMRG